MGISGALEIKMLSPIDITIDCSSKEEREMSLFKTKCSI
jgi:hypothetical protein